MNYHKKDNELLLDLWNPCENRCVFCYNKGIMNLPLDLHQHLKTCNDILNSPFIENFNCLRLLGGELFDNTYDKLNVKVDFYIILQSILNLMKHDKIKRLNFLTNLIYDNNIHLKETLEFFENNGVLNKIELSTSYDKFGRFTEESEQWWWNNIYWLKQTYPNIPLDITIILTQPFIETITKEWLDTYIQNLGNYNVHFTELDIALEENTNKYNCSYSHLFPKRIDFLKFLNKLKDWGYSSLFGVNGDDNPWNTINSIQYVLVKDFKFPLFKNTSLLVQERSKFKQDGYIDSDVPLYIDIKKVLEL